MRPGRDDPGSHISFSRFDAGPLGRFDVGAENSIRGRRSWMTEKTGAVRHIVEHHPVALGVYLLDTQPDVIQNTLHVRAPRREVRHCLLERRHPLITIIGHVGDAEGFELGEEIGELSVTIDIAGFWLLGR